MTESIEDDITVYICTCILKKHKLNSFRTFQENKNYHFKRLKSKSNNRIYYKVYLDYNKKGQESEYENMYSDTFLDYFSTTHLFKGIRTEIETDE